MNSAQYLKMRNDNREQADRYQDFVMELLLERRGLPVLLYTSQHYQLQKGESLSRVEIKFDRIYHTSGNLWVEVGEKAMGPRPGAFPQAGILRQDNSWLWVMGDYRTLFMFTKKTLLQIYDSQQYPIRPNNFDSGLGFLLPGDHAREAMVFTEVCPENRPLGPDCRGRLGWPASGPPPQSAEAAPADPAEDVPPDDIPPPDTPPPDLDTDGRRLSATPTAPLTAKKIRWSL